ncbi:MAG: diacylglycerol kinase family lipid kinase [Actinomycetota bacterium]|nr:diacylglycerol kinase family lipid kinase [Actinomycetota bacterium]
MSSPFGPMLLICNSRSGRGGVARALPEVQEHLENRNLEYELRYTEGPGHATELARAALASGTRFLVAVGGDGTVHEVVNGMIDDDRAVDPDAVLGVVAAGTGSDFIKTFGMRPLPGAAVAHLDGGNSFPIDIGKIVFTEDGRQVTRYFPNIAEAGLGAEVVARAARLPRWLGPTVYLFAFWLTMSKHKPAQVKVDLVDRTYEGSMNNLVVANGQFFGGGMKIAPKAAPTDGLLDVQIEHARKKDAIAMMPKVFKGAHLPHPDVVEAKRVKVSISADRPLLIEADGEVLGHTPATFEVLRDVISLKV